MSGLASLSRMLRLRPTVQQISAGTIDVVAMVAMQRILAMGSCPDCATSEVGNGSTTMVRVHSISSQMTIESCAITVATTRC